MSTITGSGISSDANAKSAAAEAVHRAGTALGGAKPSYGLLFASPERDLRLTLECARDAAAGAQIIGATTAGEITEAGLVHGSVAVLLVASDTSSASMAFAEGLKDDHQQT